MDRKQERILLGLLALMQFSHIVDFMIIMPLGERLQAIYDITPGQFSVIVSSYTFSSGTIALVASFFIDRFDRRHAILAAFAGLILGTFATSLAPTYELLVLARIATGAFGGLLSGLVLSIIGDVVPNERRGSAMGVVMAAFSAAAVLGVPLGLLLANMGDWHFPFMALGGLGTLILIAAFAFVPSVRGHLDTGFERPNPFRVFANAFSKINQLKALGLMFFLVLGQFTVIPFIAPYLETNVGFSENQVTLMYFLGGLATFISAPLIGRLADRFGRIPVFTSALLLSLVPLYLVSTMGPIQPYIAYSVMVAFFIFISGRMIPATTMVTSSVPPSERGSFMSINTALREFSGALGTLIAGVIISKQAITGYYINYEIVGYFAIAGSIIALFIGRTIKMVDGGPNLKKPTHGDSDTSGEPANPKAA